MADEPSIDPYKFMSLIHNPDDDTLTRLFTFPSTTPEDHNSIPNQPIFVRDISLNTAHKTWLRLFKPNNPPPTNTKLPLVVYFPGGGFILCSASDTMNHDFCNNMAIQLPAYVISVGYRLAPENRLPAAYEDAVDAINWIRNQDLGDMVDFSNCYLMGISAGANIAYNAGLRALSLDMKPLVIRGFIFNQPFFSGLERTESESRLANCNIFPLAISELMWELSLPKGSNRDHEYCNPLVDGSYKDKIGLLGRCFLNVRGGDILMDRQLEFGKMLEENGVSVVTWFKEDGYHGMDLLEPEKARDLFAAVKNFLTSSLIL